MWKPGCFYIFLILMRVKLKQMCLVLRMLLVHQKEILVIYPPLWKSWVKNLGVIFDDGLKSCFFQLWLLAKVKSILSGKNFEKVIHAFITSRLDYCNSLYFGISQSALSPLQMCKMSLQDFWPVQKTGPYYASFMFPALVACALPN